MAEKFPKTTWIFRRKAGRDYFDDDPNSGPKSRKRAAG